VLMEGRGSGKAGTCTILYVRDETPTTCMEAISNVCVCVYLEPNPHRVYVHTCTCTYICERRVMTLLLVAEYRWLVAPAQEREGKKLRVLG
jgi:hypothetical protein